MSDKTEETSLHADSPWGKPSGGKGRGGGPRGGDENPLQDALNQIFAKMQKHAGGGGKGSGSANNPEQSRILVVIGAAIALFSWLSSGVYTIEPEEQGVVMRFGAFHRITDPGLNFRLPSPFETLVKVPVTTINRVEVGVRDAETGSYRTTTKSSGIPEESLMLTGDENIVNINFEVQWRIRDAAKYLFSVYNPQDTVRSVSESAMREVVGRTPIVNALTEGRLTIEQATQAIIQKVMDDYQAGVEVVRVQLREVQPPAPVIEAFRDVQNAKADKESEINKAEAYRNDILPRARGEAEKILQDAEAYKEKVVSLAKGEASRFDQIYSQYSRSKEVVRTRMYVEAMEQVLKDTDKIIMDGSGKGAGNVLPYMALPELRGGSKPQTGGQ